MLGDIKAPCPIQSKSRCWSWDWLSGPAGDPVLVLVPSLTPRDSCPLETSVFTPVQWSGVLGQLSRHTVPPTQSVWGIFGPESPPSPTCTNLCPLPRSQCLGEGWSFFAGA